MSSKRPRSSRWTPWRSTALSIRTSGGKELLGFRKKNEDAQARKEGLKRAKEEVDPRITEQAVERRIMKRINDAKRRKNNLEDEI